jgi:hypothetical protein
MSKLTSFLIACFSTLSGGFVVVPAQASVPVVSLMKGQTQYIEMSLEPGQYLVHINAGGDAAKASFSMYETNGKLINQSSKLPPELQAPNSDQGAVFKISHAKAVHFWIRMDTCKTFCAASLVTVKVGSGTINVIEPSSKVLPARPSYSLTQAPPPSSTQKQGQPEIIVNDSNPSTCDFLKDNNSQDQCSKLKLLRVVSKDRSIEAFSINFFFKDVVVTYVVPVNIFKTIERNGIVFKKYPVLIRALQKKGQESQSSTKNDEENCLIASDYSALACGSPKSLYTYTQ